MDRLGFACLQWECQRGCSVMAAGGRDGAAHLSKALWMVWRRDGRVRFQVKVLGANNSWVIILNLMNTGGSLVGYGFWVKLIRTF